jgi:hypothetical protein
MHTRPHMHTHAHTMHAHMHTHTSTQVHAHTPTQCTCTFAHMCTCTHPHAGTPCTCVHPQAHSCTHTYTHKHTYTCAHMHTHSHTYVCKLSLHTRFCHGKKEGVWFSRTIPLPLEPGRSDLGQGKVSYAGPSFPLSPPRTFQEICSCRPLPWMPWAGVGGNFSGPEAAWGDACGDS